MEYNTPKQKAKEIFKKYKEYFDWDYMEEHISDYVACEYAVMCVEEIISACEFNNVESYNTDWWNKVIKEIKKL